MGKARFFLISSLLFLLVNFILNLYQLPFDLTQYLFYLWLGLVVLLILTFFNRYFFWGVVILLAILRFDYFSQAEINTQANFQYEQFYTFTAEVVDLDKKLNGWQVIIEPQDLENFHGKILLNTELYPEYDFQQVLEVSCKLNQPEVIIDEKGKAFYYDKYLAKSGIYATCYRPRIKILDQLNNWQNILRSSQQYFWQNLNNYLVEPASSLAKAMLLADRREMPADLRTTFSQTGLSHVVAISGLHIAIIVWLLQAFLLGLGLRRQHTFILLSLILLTYLWLLGFPSSAVRASLMVTLVLVGPYFGRQTMSVYSLLLAANILVLANPYLLVYDIGFQLSFLAVLGLLLYVKWFNKILKFIPNYFKIREMVSVTLAAQVFTWPLIVYYFHIFSSISPITNLFVLPLLPAVLIFSILLSIFGFLPIIAQIISWPLFLLLKFINSLAVYLAQIPYAYFELENFSLISLITALSFTFILTFIIRPYEVQTD